MTRDRFNWDGLIRAMLIGWCAGALVAILTGCSTRENAKAAIQADQAVAAADEILTGRELAAALAELPDDQRREVERIVRGALDLLRSGRVSLGPVVALLSQGKPVQVETSVAQAVREPQRFIATAGRQAGRAEAESEAILGWMRIGETVFAIAGEAAGSLLSTTLLGSGGGLGIVALIIQHLRAMKLRTAVATTAEMVDEVSRAETDDDVVAVKKRFAEIQRKRGVDKVIAKARGKA